MAETRTYQGHTYTRSGPGEPWVLVGPSQPGPVTLGQPSAKPAVDIANVESTIADRARDNARADAEAARQAEAARRDQLEWEATHFPDGTPKPKAATTEQASPDRIPQIETMLENIRRVREMADDTLAVGTWSGRVGDWPIVGPALGQNRANIEGALQMIQGDLIQQQIALLSEMNGGKGVASIANSETEAARMAASIANLSPDQSLEEFLVGLDRAEQYYLRQLDRRQAALGTAPVALSAAGVGATEQARPIPPEMQAENEAWLTQNLATATPQDYAQFRQALDRKYGFDSASEAGLVSWFEGAQRNAAQGGTVKTAIPPANEELSGFDKYMNDVVSSGSGTVLASMANAGGFGIPSLLTGGKMDALRDLNPGAAAVGDMAGGATGSALAAKGLGLLAGRVGGGTIESLLTNPMVADMAYGGVYSAAEGDNPLLGVATSAGGSWLGSKVGRAVTPRPADALSTGERAIAGAVNDLDPVVSALMQADELGVPMTLADASPELGSLAGSSTRFSPTVAGDARSVMARRNAGQLDRLGGAVERDLGPVTNIPQRSEELLQQARAAARPLYEAAYVAPGASSVNLDDLVQRPTFAEALSEAAREAADEGVDPRTLGFDFNEAGDVVLGTTPSWQTLDYAKRGLDNIIERETDKLNGLSSAGRRALAMKNELLGRMDAVNPDYAAARQAYAGPAAERTFLAQGQAAINTRPDQLGVDVARLTPEQRSQMQLGYQSELMGRAGDVRNNNNPWAQLNTPNTEGRLNTLYDGSGGADIPRLLAQRDLELRLAGSANRLVGNSATAEREVADAFFRQQPGMMDTVGPAIIETAALGGPWLTVGRGIANRVFRDRREAAALQANRALADDLGPLLLNDAPGAAAITLDDIVQRDAEYQAVIEALLEKAGQRGGHVGAGVATALVN